MQRQWFGAEAGSAAAALAGVPAEVEAAQHRGRLRTARRTLGSPRTPGRRPALSRPRADAQARSAAACDLPPEERRTAPEDRRTAADQSFGTSLDTSSVGS
ncbi:hypothetical protein SLNWT_5672 [Streptomyces albus]|uniref:Uncharacterized protein n=1 Tax=Streptomyces albus (strain ATCC 21838 / DSM 41398 / FERM P-419 / JCM 4703 / NBRC 107858) TaxID=1081613 RepID=A0A0B5ET90_STRA4|nr:hypothetical protein SLNWT_5672 [Streptomyces albus]AOU80349.1 hypothetical protein SLNHY_5658 [Streptomyces albus]AYN36060.1 hypothetical protein DUI70_5565 [Streptomyces albus]